MPDKNTTNGNCPNWALCCLLFLGLMFGVFGGSVVVLYTLYNTVETGDLELTNAPGKVSIVRERDTKILHIKGEDWVSIAYGQGFASGQTRLWQMEVQRRIATGTLSEIVGDAAYPIDEFMRHVGL